MDPNVLSGDIERFKVVPCSLKGREMCFVCFRGAAWQAVFGLNQPWRPLLIDADGEFYVAQPMLRRPPSGGAWRKCYRIRLKEIQMLRECL